MRKPAAKRSPQSLGQFEIKLDHGPLAFELKRSPTARLIWLKIDREANVIVTIPRGYDTRLVPEYLRKNLKWIIRNLEKCRRQMAASQTTTKSAGLSYLGQPLELVLEPRPEGTASIQIKQDKLILGLSPSTPAAKNKILTRWFKDKAASVIRSKCDALAQRIGVDFNRITLRDQKTRWASCSHKRNLSFNWRLIMVPEPVLDYVIIHELCHLKEMNHSKRFWGLVSKHNPDWKEHRKWMNSHGGGLKASLS
jgi:predicted metal-dependent hydrolase